MGKAWTLGHLRCALCHSPAQRASCAWGCAPFVPHRPCFKFDYRLTVWISKLLAFCIWASTPSCCCVPDSGVWRSAVIHVIALWYTRLWARISVRLRVPSPHCRLFIFQLCSAMKLWFTALSVLMDSLLLNS